MARVNPCDRSLWRGREDGFEYGAYYWHQALAREGDPAPVAFLGFACDQGVRRNQGRVGARLGSRALKQAFARLPISHRFLRAIPFSRALVADLGEVECLDGAAYRPEVLEEAQSLYAQEMAEALARHGLCIGLGGGHELAWASFSALWQFLGEKAQYKRIGIINFDAHFDLRDAPEPNSGTPFLQIARHLKRHRQDFNYFPVGISAFANSAALFNKADSMGVRFIIDEECFIEDFAALCRRLDDFCAQVDVLYLSFDFDVLQASAMPAVSAPAAFGLSLSLTERLLQHVIRRARKKIALLDFAEFNPLFDCDEHGARAAARLIAGAVETWFLAGEIWRQ